MSVMLLVVILLITAVPAAATDQPIIILGEESFKQLFDFTGDGRLHGVAYHFLRRKSNPKDTLGLMEIFSPSGKIHEVTVDLRRQRIAFGDFDHQWPGIEYVIITITDPVMGPYVSYEATVYRWTGDPKYPFVGNATVWNILRGATSTKDTLSKLRQHLPRIIHHLASYFRARSRAYGVLRALQVAARDGPEHVKQFLTPHVPVPPATNLAALSSTEFSEVEDHVLPGMGFVAWSKITADRRNIVICLNERLQLTGVVLGKPGELFGAGVCLKGGSKGARAHLEPSVRLQIYKARGLTP